MELSSINANTEPYQLVGVGTVDDLLKNAFNDIKKKITMQIKIIEAEKAKGLSEEAYVRDGTAVFFDYANTLKEKGEDILSRLEKLNKNIVNVTKERRKSELQCLRVKIESILNDISSAIREVELAGGTDEFNLFKDSRAQKIGFNDYSSMLVQKTKYEDRLEKVISYLDMLKDVYLP